MKMRNLMVGGLALAFALGTSTMAVAVQGKKGALEAIDKLAKKAKDASFADDCKAAAGSLELDPVMHSFKPRARGGFGIGPKAGLVPANQDGIEAYLPALSKKGMSAADAGKMSEPVIEMANRVLAIAEVSDHLWPENKESAKSKKKWLELNQLMKDGSKELAEAVSSKNFAAVKKAAGKLNTSCSECHSVFRD
jgi:hypothetical protein